MLSPTWQARPDLPRLVLLSSSDENALLAATEAACPGHTFTAVRGRIHGRTGFAFFRRRPDRTLDEADVRTEHRPYKTCSAACTTRAKDRGSYSATHGSIAAATAILGNPRLP